MADELETEGEHQQIQMVAGPRNHLEFHEAGNQDSGPFSSGHHVPCLQQGTPLRFATKTTTRTRRKSCASTARASDAIKELQRGTTSETSIRRNRDTAIFLPLPSKLMDSSPCRCGADVIRCVRPTLVRARWYQSNRPQAGNTNGVPGDRFLSRKLGERVVLWVRHEPANPA